MTAAELRQVRETILQMHEDICDEGGQDYPQAPHVKRTLAMLALQIPDESRALPALDTTYPTQARDAGFA